MMTGANEPIIRFASTKRTGDSPPDHAISILRFSEESFRIHKFHGFLPKMIGELFYELNQWILFTLAIGLFMLSAEIGYR